MQTSTGELREPSSANYESRQAAGEDVNRGRPMYMTIDLEPIVKRG